MNSQTAVFLGEKTFAVVTGRTAARGGVELTHAAVAMLPADFATRDAAGKAEAVRTALEATSGGARKCVLVVPRPLAILRTFTVPAGSPQEVQDMIHFQLEKELPLPLEQVRTSYSIQPDDGHVSVTATAVPIEALNQRIAALEAAGMRVTGAVVSSYGLIRLLPPGPVDGGSLLLGLADGGAEIMIAESGRIQLSRNTPLRDPNAEGWAAEIDRAILSHSAKGAGAPLHRIFVAGEGDPADTVATELARRIPNASVTALVPNHTVTRRPDVRITAEAASTAGVVIGLLGPGPAIPDLLHAPVVRRTLRFSRTHKITAGVAAVVFAALIGSQVWLAARRGEAESLRKDLSKFKPKAVEVDRMRAEIKTLQQWQDRRFAWIDVFNELQRRLPANRIFLVSFNADESGVVRLSGKAKDKGAALDFATELQKLGPVLSEVGTPTVRGNNDKSEYSQDFEIRVTLADLAPPAKKKKAAPAPKKS